MALVAATVNVTLVPAIDGLAGGLGGDDRAGLVPVLAGALMTLLFAVPAMVRTTVLLVVLPLLFVATQ